MNLQKSAKVLIGLVGLLSLIAILIIFGGSYWYGCTENRNFEELRKKSELNCQTMATHCAIKAKDKALLATLLTDNRNLDSVDGWGSSALHFAVANESAGKTEFVQMLIDAKIDVHQENEQGDDALTVALRLKRFDLAELLLKSGADPDRLIGLKGQKRLNRLGTALLNSHIETVLFLIDHGASRDVKDEFGYSYCERLKLHNLESSFPRCGE